MTSQPGKQTIAIHILINISRSKGNKAMTFSQLIDYNLRNIFFKKSYPKRDGETIPRPFAKKSKLSISLAHLELSISNVLYDLLVFYAKLRTIEIY